MDASAPCVPSPPGLCHGTRAIADADARANSGTFALFASACFGAYLWATHAVPETGGVPLEDMDAVFGAHADAGVAARDAGVRREVRGAAATGGAMRRVLTLRGLQIEEELGLWDVVRRHGNDA
jgi:hypothetical protein